jgi:L-threonylcarbamoyladenylate synthase
VSPDRSEIEQAAETLRRGGLVAFPTETVYGLGCDAESPVALRRLYRVKRRPADHPVIVHLGDAAMLDAWAREVPTAARALAAACWPGPLTLVVRRLARVPDEVTGGRDTVGLRVPDQPLALALLDAFGGGIAAPSANHFGRTSPTTAADVRADLGSDVDMVLDGGPCTIGVESTIVDCTTVPLEILRVGGVPSARIEQIVGAEVLVRTDRLGRAPGTLPAHYAPRAAVTLVERPAVAARAASLLSAGRSVALLAGAPVPDGLPGGLVVLDPPTDADDYARVLYARLRDADRHGVDVLLVVAPEPVGIGEAVADRLHRAAAAAPATSSA